jgi:hypothetical protein
VGVGYENSGAGIIALINTGMTAVLIHFPVSPDNIYKASKRMKLSDIG